MLKSKNKVPVSWGWIKLQAKLAVTQWNLGDRIPEDSRKEKAGRILLG